MDSVAEDNAVDTLQDQETVEGSIKLTKDNVNGVSECKVSPNTESSNTDEVDNTGILLQYYCGAGPCRPKHLQIFTNAKFFTFLLCVFGLVEGALISGFEPVIISSLERRYKFSSTAASLIISVFDIAVVISVIFVSYFGEKGHKPRWVGVAFCIQGIGAFVFALPQFIFGSYQVGSSVDLSFEACNANDTLQYVSECTAGNSIAYVLFLLGNIIMGIGAAPLFTIGVSYIDDIVYPKWVSIHIGLFQVSTIAGPAVGFGIGSVFLKLYVDPSETTTLTESDPSWVGAWWLGFIVVGIVSILCSIPFFFYPRLLDDSHLVMKERQKQMIKTYKSKFGEEKSFLEQVKAFPYHLLGLFKSKSWLFITIGISALFLSLDGLVSFAPKYVESVYRVPPSTAGLIIGALGIIAGALGTLTGAFLSYCVKAGKNIAFMNWVITLMAVFPLIGFFFYCPNLNVVGINVNYNNNSINAADDVLLSACNAGCDCSSTVFEPVCGADGLTYFSPCRASCDRYTEIDGNMTIPVFENCSCVADNLYGNMRPNDMASDYIDILNNSTALRGLCGDFCPYLPVFVLVVTVFVFLIFSIRVPFLLVTIRSVADEQRSLALAVQSVMFRVFGSIPGPILFGVLIDSGCVYFQTECGRRGNCWVYDNSVLAVRAYIFTTVGVLACVIAVVLSWIFYPPVTTCKKTSSVDEEKDEQPHSESVQFQTSDGEDMVEGVSNPLAVTKVF